MKFRKKYKKQKKLLRAGKAASARNAGFICDKDFIADKAMGLQRYILGGFYPSKI